MDIIPYASVAQDIGRVTGAAPHNQVMSLDQCIAAWLDEKHRRSKSDRTRDAYRETLQSFRALLQAQGLDLDASPSVVFPVAQGWAGRTTSIRRQGVSANTFNTRISILTSFYEYAIRADVLTINPMKKVERSRGSREHQAHALSTEQVRKGLVSIDRSTAEGLRDYALLQIALNTGHRATELAGLRLKHLRRDGNKCHITWPRCKGDKQMQSLLEVKTTTALYAYLQHEEVYGNRLFTSPGDAPVWVSFSARNEHQAIGTRTISNICRDVLGDSRVHTTRHTAALVLHKQGATLQEVGKFLGHSDLKTTSVYLEELAGYENRLASQLEDMFDI